MAFGPLINLPGEASAGTAAGGDSVTVTLLHGCFDESQQEPVPLAQWVPLKASGFTSFTVKGKGKGAGGVSGDTESNREKVAAEGPTLVKGFRSNPIKGPRSTGQNQGGISCFNLAVEVKRLSK